MSKIYMNYNPETISSNNNEMSSLNEQQVQQLRELGFTRSLAQSMQNVQESFARRIWIVDNSSSMNANDGHLIVDDKDKRRVQMKNCSRWQEIRSCVEYHMRLASTIEAPTTFRLLNPPRRGAPSEFEIAFPHRNHRFEVEDAVSELRRIEPRGTTPLTEHIEIIRAEVASMEEELRRTGQRIAIIIATDGLPTDSSGHGGKKQQADFVRALRMLEGLPIWLVIRLCTDEDKVVDFYNDIDALLELSIDVLDDFTAEAKEIQEVNPWINYALPLHRVREFGHPNRLFDLIDERAFTRSEVRDYCSLLFGDIDGIPDPAIEWKQFLGHIERASEKESVRYHPIKKRPKPWVSTRKLAGPFRLFRR